MSSLLHPSKASNQYAQSMITSQYMQVYSARTHASSSCSEELSSDPCQSSLSRPSRRMKSDETQPRMARPPKTLQAMASPLGRMLMERLKSPPETKGPKLRPRAERVWAMPLRLPRLECEGAELVIWIC